MASDLLLKTIGIFFIILVVGAMALFAFGVLSALWFWVVLGVGAVVAYVVVPFLRHR